MSGLRAVGLLRSVFHSVCAHPNACLAGAAIFMNSSLTFVNASSTVSFPAGVLLLSARASSSAALPFGFVMY